MGIAYELLVEDIKDEWITRKGYFAQMVKNTNIKNANFIYSMARKSYFNKI